MLKRNQSIAAIAISCGVLSILASATQAQVFSPLRTNQPQVVTLQAFHNKTGEFVGMSGNYLKCILDGTPVTVQFQKNSRVKVTGAATADALAPGMYVQFKGSFNRFGKAAEPIKDVVIYAPDAATQPGAYAAGSGGGFDEPASSKKKGPVPATSVYQISGKITAAHKNNIHVDCGNMKVKADIAPDATVKLDTSDLSWASPGDRITISGAILGPGRAIGMDATIELAAPLVGKKKSHAAHASEKTADKSAKPADKDGKPAPADAAADKGAKAQ